MSAPGTPKASEAAVAAVQDVLGKHQRTEVMDGERFGGGLLNARLVIRCTCGELFGLDHVAVAAADAAAPWIAAPFIDENRALRDEMASLWMDLPAPEVSRRWDMLMGRIQELTAIRIAEAATAALDGDQMCRCGHKLASHHGGQCYGCTGPECDPEMRALDEPLDLGGGEGVVRRAEPLFYDGYCISHAKRDCDWCEADRIEAGQ